MNTYAIFNGIYFLQIKSQSSLLFVLLFLFGIFWTFVKFLYYGLWTTLQI